MSFDVSETPTCVRPSKVIQRRALLQKIELFGMHILHVLWHDNELQRTLFKHFLLL